MDTPLIVQVKGRQCYQSIMTWEYISNVNAKGVHHFVIMDHDIQVIVQQSPIKALTKTMT